MAGRNQAYLNRGWMEVDGKQMVRMEGSSNARCRAASLGINSVGSSRSRVVVNSPRSAHMPGRGDLTPRRRLVYDADRVEFYYALSEGGMRRGR